MTKIFIQKILEFSFNLFPLSCSYVITRYNITPCQTPMCNSGQMFFHFSQEMDQTTRIEHIHYSGYKALTWH